VTEASHSNRLQRPWLQNRRTAWCSSMSTSWLSPSATDRTSSLYEEGVLILCLCSLLHCLRIISYSVTFSVELTWIFITLTVSDCFEQYSLVSAVANGRLGAGLPTEILPSTENLAYQVKARLEHTNPSMLYGRIISVTSSLQLLQ